MKPQALLLLCTVLAGSMSAQGAATFLQTHCLDCHSPGQVRGEVPMIDGQHAGYLRHQLQRFRDRHRQAFPMSALSAGMNEAGIDALVADLSKRPWPVDQVPVAKEAVARGRRRAAQLSCDSCHGKDFEGGGDVPRIAGQQPGYLARQIAAFGVGHRWHPPTGSGAPMHVVEPAEARDIAAYLHALGGNRSKPDSAPARGHADPAH